MIRTILPILASALFILCFARCQENVPEPEPAGAMSAIIASENWEADLLEASYRNGRLALTGSALDERAVTVNLQLDGSVPQTIALTRNSISALAYSPIEGAAPYLSNAGGSAGGVVQITALDTVEEWVSGTFQATCVRLQSAESVQISDGFFARVPYTDTLSPIVGNGLQAKIDGAAWQPDTVQTVVEAGAVAIAAEKAAGQRIVLSIPDSANPGDYDLDPSGEFSAAYFPAPGTELPAVSGQLSIEKFDKDNRRVEGTFYFDAAAGSQSATVSEGAFGINY